MPQRDSPDFYEIALQDLLTGRDLPFEIFIRLSDQKFVKLANRSGDIAREQLLAYEASGVTALFLRAEDYMKAVGVELPETTPALSPPEEQSLAELQREAGAAAELVFSGELNEFTYEVSKTVVDSVLVFAARNRQILAMLTAFQTSEKCRALYKHSVVTSLYSVMIALRMGWTATGDLYQLGLGGLLHDVSPHSVRPEAQGEETDAMRSWRNHPIQAAATLKLLDGVPPAVVEIAMQHHETFAGTGFPHGLAGEKIHPMARIVALADGFCELALAGGLPPLVDTVARLRASGLYESRALAALENLIQA